MDNVNQVLLDEVIEQKLRELKDLPTDSEERTKAIAEVNQLYKLRIEEAKIDQEYFVACREVDAKRKEFKSKSLERWLGFGAQVFTVLATTVAYNAWFNRGLKFSETGTFSEPMTRNLLSRIIPNRK